MKMISGMKIGVSLRINAWPKIENRLVLRSARRNLFDHENQLLENSLQSVAWKFIAVAWKFITGSINWRWRWRSAGGSKFISNILQHFAQCFIRLLSLSAPLSFAGLDWRLVLASVLLSHCARVWIFKIGKGRFFWMAGAKCWYIPSLLVIYNKM